MKISTLQSVLLASFVAILAFGGSACTKTGSNSGGISKMKVYLTDNPAAYDKVFIDVQSIKVHASATADTSDAGWQTLALLRPGVYNLLDFRNGIDTVLADVSYPAGRISQMRMILGPNNAIVKNGVTYPLTTPSSQQSGLKFNIDAELTAGVEYALVIDFDAARSVVETGNGKYILKPVIRTFAKATGGSIKGYVLPREAKPMVTAIMSPDTLSAIPDSTSGYYLFAGLKAGTWTLLYTPGDTSYAVQSKLATVTVGAVTTVDSVVLQKK